MLETFWTTLIGSPFFGLSLSISTYYVGILISRKIKSPIANPLLIGTFLCIVFLELTGISYETYSIGGDIIYMFLGPMTAILAVTVYNRYEVLKKNFIPVLMGTLVGSMVSIGSITIMCKLFGLDKIIFASLAPKSVTAAISLQLSEMGGGIAAITFAAATITGMVGAMGGPFLAKIFRIKEKTAIGLAVGTSSHALGTTRAIQMGETEGAMSSIAIALAGVATVLLYSILPII